MLDEICVTFDLIQKTLTGVYILVTIYGKEQILTP